MIATLVKQPSERLRQAVPFMTMSPIAAVIAVVVAARGLVPGAPALVATASIAAGQVIAELVGGGDGERYLVTVRVETDGGAQLESELEIAVVESTWQLPDGGAPYVSIGTFVDVFTLSEVVAMTDPDGSGRIDRALLIKALTYAQAIAESHLAGRYALPLSTVPPVIEMAIADLARARLYPRGLPETVDTAAKAATRTLEAIAAGRMTLGLPAVAAPAAPASDAPVLIAPGRRQYPDGLADY